MQIKKLILACIIILLVSTSAFTITTVSESQTPPKWNKDWRYRQEIYIPISTKDEFAIYQPIDVQIEFKNPCWAKNETTHSIRVLCWNDNKWYELESQIYDLEYSDSKYIKRCGLIFLIPNVADGEERYFIYYDKAEKNPPNYTDHVNINDKYYYYEPLTGISAEADYYEIREDGYVVYGIGQKGKAINRWLSQVAVKQKPKSEKFSLLESDNLAIFCFSYHNGNEDKDEISSDQELISKEIIVDGNLMAEFRITSQSYDENIRTTNIYKYYYCPTDTKRINVHVKHQVLKDATVKGIIDIDGRYGAIISYKSTSEKIKKMQFGEILPFLHVYGENDQIKEYQMILDPEDKKREWIIQYNDDCDIGDNSWLSYDEGKVGKAHAIIFSSNNNLIKSGTDERDGIQIEVAAREYLEVFGSEIDHLSINWGRNSYENGGDHDIDIPGDLFVEYDAEFYTTEQGGYKNVIKEAGYYQTLIKHRHINSDTEDNDDEKIYTLTVKPKGTARFFSSPISSNLTSLNITSIFAELYLDSEYISTVFATKPLLGPPNIKFPKIAKGNYTIKVFRKTCNYNKTFIGLDSIELKEDTEINIFCTWPINLKVNALDQYSNYIEDIDLYLYKNESIVDKKITQKNSDVIFTTPFILMQPYNLKAFYKGFKIYDDEISILAKKTDINLNLYNLDISVDDNLGFSPGVDVRPYLESLDMFNKTQIYPDYGNSGEYLFEKIPAAEYILYLSHGSFSDEIEINVPTKEKVANIEFKANYDLSIELFDSLGTPISNENKKIDIYRNGKIICNSLCENEIISLPPAEYTAYVYSKDKLIAQKNIFLTYDKNEKIITSVESIIPTLLTILSIIVILEVSFVFIIKKISLNTFLKLLAMSLILISIVQPWWILNASNIEQSAEKNSEMFIISGTIIEKYNYDQSVYLDIATIPEMFTEFLVILLSIVILGLILLGFSFLPNIIYKKRFYKILIFSSVLFLLIVTFSYYTGMSRITELSLGSLQGQGTLEVVLPNQNIVNMDANWGLGIGFYLCVLSAVMALFAGVSDFIIKKISNKKN